MLKVAAFVDYSDPLGGLLSWVSDLLEHSPMIQLELVGVVTDTIRPSWASIIDPDLPVPAVPVHRGELRAVRRSVQPDRLPSRLQKLVMRPRVYVPNAYETGYQLAAIARRFGVPSSVVSFCHADEPHYYFLAERYEALISRFVAADTRCYQGLLARLPHRKGDIAMVRHGIRVPRPYRRRQRSELRLVYVGRVVQRQKQVFDLIRLAAALRVLEVPFRLDVIGDGDDRIAFEQAAATTREISCLGPMRRRNVLTLYRDYDCLVLCSSFEGSSIALIESMARGIVPVVTDVGGARDVVSPGVEGFLWEPGEVEKAATLLRDLWRDPRQLAACARAARRRMQREHDPAGCAAELLAVLVDAAAHPMGSRYEADRLVDCEGPSPYFPQS
jgi:glycosyltransferase involved in cell wall biosynthesis